MIRIDGFDSKVDVATGAARLKIMSAAISAIIIVAAAVFVQGNARLGTRLPKRRQTETTWRI